MISILCGIVDFMRLKVILDSQGITERKRFQKDVHLSWSDMQEADFVMGFLNLKGNQTVIGISEKLKGFPELMQQVIAKRPDIFTTKSHASPYFSFIYAIFMLLALILGILAWVENGVFQWLLILGALYFLTSALLQPYSLKIEDRRLELKSILRKRVILRDDVLDVQWTHRPTRKRAHAMHAKIILTQGEPLRLSHFTPGDYHLYQTLQQWWKNKPSPDSAPSSSECGDLHRLPPIPHRPHE
ncbi:hypothetical protein [Cerasicoccus frondis]|uniref:hypothetical protein n=1 Tax=Cerasicoccus frondis TaxID=490090 RepID=UPI002852A089|nr:hypothetical protein [Cerasicoccus frondis]